MFRRRLGSLQALVLTLVFGAFGFSPTGARAVPAEGQRLMIAGPSPLAVAIGKEIHRAGGNTADVAVAVALSLAVTHPYYAALGGGGFAMVKADGKVSALDFRETAPRKADEGMFVSAAPTASLDGGLAVGVPGVVAGLWELHRKHGKLKWAKLVAPSIRLAEKGFEVSGEWVFLTTINKDRFNREGQALLFKKDGSGYGPGELFKQPRLATFLRVLSSKGSDAFYKGKYAKDLATFIKSAGGRLDLEDLNEYKVRWIEPLVTEFKGHRLHLMPPPSSGGVVIAQATKLIEELKIAEQAPLSSGEAHLLAEAMKLSYRGRSLLGDPAFVKNPIEKLLDPAELKRLASLVRSERALDVETLKPVANDSENTTHFSVMDAAGNTVALTVTLNGDYGSGLVEPNSGIALNNEMDDFTTKPGQPNMFGLIQGRANLVRPGARPLSSMSPTIVEKNGKTVLSLGAPGGPRIISGVLQVLYRSLTQDFDVDQAVQAPRLHHQFLPNVVRVDSLKWAPDVLEKLQARGHKIETGSTGKVYAIRLGDDGILRGAADARGEAGVGGY